VRCSRGPVVAVLNPDILVGHDDVVTRLLRHFADESVGVVAPRLVLPNGHPQDSARQVPNPAQLLRRRLTGRESGGVNATRPVDVDWVVAAFTLIRREAFDDVGGFDPRYRLYFEDVDLCVRMWSAGWRVRYDPTVSVRHEHRAASKKSLIGWPMRQHARSAALFYRRHPDLLLASGRRRLMRPGRDHGGGAEARPSVLGSDDQ
jgi:GT2 family glycosyltransferase